MKHLKSINELHKDTYQSARDKHSSYVGDDEVARKYDRFIKDGEYIEITDRTKDYYKKLRKDNRANGSDKNWRDSKLTIDTYLPMFDGFYDTIFDLEWDMESEIEYINDEREEKGWGEINSDNVEWEYRYEEFCKNMTETIEEKLKDIGFNIKIQYKSLYRPKSYNYGNDHINIELTCNKIQLFNYLYKYQDEYEEYLDDNNLTDDGYDLDNISFEAEIVHDIFSFVLDNENYKLEEFYEDSRNGELYVSATNFTELTENEIV